MIRERWALTKEYKDTCIAILQDNLAPLRAKASITQEELANIIGCSRQTYYAFETCQRTMPWSSFLLLCFFYHELKSTREMLDALKIYPVELFSKFNEEVSVTLFDENHRERQKAEILTIKERTLTIKLSDADVLRVCKKAGAHNITVAKMVESYLQDLVYGTYTNGSDERECANEYFERCSYSWSWRIDNTFTRYLIESGFINDYMDDIEDENYLKGEIAIYENIEEPTADDLQELEALKEDLEELQDYILDYYREYSEERKESETEPLEEAQSGVLKWYEEYKKLKGQTEE